MLCPSGVQIKAVAVAMEELVRGLRSMTGESIKNVTVNGKIILAAIA
ncbi:hypothetical protein [Microcoleus sp. CAWBG58]|nr:hypothetical protein [Microcoleus sp. CAWBG58]